MLSKSVEQLSKMRLFKHLGPRELLVELAVSKIVSYPRVVAKANPMYKLACRLMGKRLVNRGLAGTMGRVFTCENTEADLEKEIQRLQGNKIGSILDYCAEALTQHDSKVDLDRNAQYFKHCLQFSAKLSGSPFLSVKGSALLQLDLLAKLSTVIRALQAVHPGPPASAQALTDLLGAGLAVTPEQKAQFIANVLEATPEAILDPADWAILARPYYFSQP
jgi:hypothetical protein